MLVVWKDVSKQEKKEEEKPGRGIITTTSLRSNSKFGHIGFSLLTFHLFPDNWRAYHISNANFHTNTESFRDSNDCRVYESSSSIFNNLSYRNINLQHFSTMCVENKNKILNQSGFHFIWFLKLSLYLEEEEWCLPTCQHAYVCNAMWTSRFTGIV